MAHLPIASTSRLLLPSSLRPRPSSVRLASPLLQSSLGPVRSYARSSRSARVADTPLAGEVISKRDGNEVPKSGSKLQTIPFMCTPATAIDRLEAAAHTALGLPSLGRLLWSRFARAFLGMEVELPAEMVAFKPLLVPTWRVDLCLTGRGMLEEVEMDLFVSTTDASVPGFKLDPLDKLALISPWDAEPESYDPEVHNRQHDLDITVIPFSRSPMGLLARLARLGRSNIPDHGINLDPKSFKPVLFAGYPLYLPIYLAEYVERVPDGRRITCVALAASSKPTFTLYPNFLETPSWMPNGDSLELAVGGAPVDPADKFAPGALQAIAPQLDALVSRGQSLDFLDTLERWDEVEKDPHAMAYGEFAEEYLDKTQELATMRNTAKSLGALSDENKTVIVSIKGVKVGKGKELKADVIKAVQKAELAASFAKPEWLVKLEAEGEGEGKTLGGR